MKNRENLNLRWVWESVAGLAIMLLAAYLTFVVWGCKRPEVPVERTIILEYEGAPEEAYVELFDHDFAGTAAPTHAGWPLFQHTPLGIHMDVHGNGSIDITSSFAREHSYLLVVADTTTNDSIPFTIKLFENGELIGSDVSNPGIPHGPGIPAEYDRYWNLASISFTTAPE